MSTVTRRQVIKGVAAGAVVLGFDPVARSWITEAQADTPQFQGLPPLDGTLMTDPASLAAASDDFGHLVHRTPLAVLRAGSIKDVKTMVKYAHAHRIRLVSRGNGHTTMGQSEVDAGIVIDLRALNTIESISPTAAVVGAGVLWRDLLLATTAVGLTPPVLTDYLYLTVGGTLSVGGIGGMSYRKGMEVDNVLALTVVTGSGLIVECSPTNNESLFNAVLGGLGVFGVIVKATIKLIRAEDRALCYDLIYPDLPTMLTDFETLVRTERFDYLRANCFPGPNGFTYFIEGTNYYSLGTLNGTDHHHHASNAVCDCMNEGSLLAGLNHVGVQVIDRTYFDYCDTTDQIFAQLEAYGLIGLPHPWLDMYIPDTQLHGFAQTTTQMVDATTLIPGSVILFFGFKKSKLTKPMIRVPSNSSDTFYLFDVLFTAPPIPEVAQSFLNHNRALMEANRSLGGTHYTISSVQMSTQDWVDFYGSFWGQVQEWKESFDPHNVLGGGLTMFP